jgi:hypothetical protein
MSGTQQASQEMVAGGMVRYTLHGQEGYAKQAMFDVIWKANNTTFGVQAWKVIAPALKLSMWIQADGVAATMVSVLSLNDAGGQVAEKFYQQEAIFTSTSNDPLVQWVDSVLYNNGQPLTAGSLPIYNGGNTKASDIIPSWLGELSDAGADAMMHFYIELPFALVTAFIPGASTWVGLAAGSVATGAVTVAGAYTSSQVFGTEFTGKDAFMAFAQGAGAYAMMNLGHVDELGLEVAYERRPAQEPPAQRRSSFAAGTPVSTSEGLGPIQAMRPSRRVPKVGESHPDLPVRKKKTDPTHGIFNDKKPMMVSGRNPEAEAVFADRMDQLSEKAKIALKHVEGHAAAEMVKNKMTDATLHINYRTGPCPNCVEGVPQLLAPGQKLWVVFPDGAGFFTNEGWFPQ